MNYFYFNKFLNEKILLLAKNDVEEKRKCNEAMNSQSSSSNNEKVKECRGNMSDECSRGLDGACKASGLYERLINKPLPEAALPVVCDNTYPDYTLERCFAWLEPIIVKHSLSFSFQGFNRLPSEIDRSFRGGKSLRNLQTLTVSVDPVTKNDVKAVIPASITKMDASAISVDQATAVSAPSVEAKVASFDQTSETVTLGQNYLSFAIYSLLIFMALLF